MKKRQIRSGLAEIDGQRKRFRATFERVGKKTNFKGYSEDTILLKDVIDISDNQKVTDHLWFTYSKAFNSACIKEGDIIEFDARIKGYKKGYVNRALGLTKKKSDYKLSHPTKIAVIK